MTVTSDYQRPIPVPDKTTAPFWEYASKHQLAFQRCQHCGRFDHLPVAFCKGCHNLADPQFAFEPVSGRGTVVNWTVIHDQMVAGFQGADPIVHVLVRLEEQSDLMFPATLIGDTSKLRLDSPVVTVFKEVTDGVTLPYFELADADG